MNTWLVAQTAYAAVAWYLAAKAVVRLHHFGGYAGRRLAATVRELRGAGRGGDVARLSRLLNDAVLAPLLEIDVDAASAEDLVAVAQGVASDALPPVRLLRALATIGTTLGLLAAVATLRTGLGLGTAPGMERAAGQAFESAVAGFVTALPCWTAIALCRQRTRALYGELELTVLAQNSGLAPPEASPDHHETVDGAENAQ